MFDVHEFFDAWAAKAREEHEITFKEGIEEPLVELRRHIKDVHLGLPRITQYRPDSKVTERQAVTESRIDVKTCRLPEDKTLIPDTLRSAPLLYSDGSRRFVLTVSGKQMPEKVPVRCGDTTITLTPRKHAVRKNETKLPPYQFTSYGDVGVIRIRRFALSETEQLNALERDYPVHQKHRLLIFDLRGNNGGTNGSVLKWLEHAANGRVHTGVRLKLTSQMIQVPGLERTRTHRRHGQDAGYRGIQNEAEGNE